MTLNTQNERTQDALAHFAESLERVMRTLSPFTTSRKSSALLEARVDSGATFLDAKLGRDFWLPRVDVATLDVWSTSDCVVCQVTGMTYRDGVQVLGAPGNYGSFTRAKWADAHGFSDDIGDEFGFHRYTELTAAWVAKVNALRTADDDSVRITA